MVGADKGMARRSRNEAAAALAVAEIGRRPPDGLAVVLEDPRPDVAEVLRRSGVRVETWSRWGGDSSWPRVDGTASLVAIRLPRARRELEMLLHMAAAAAAPGGRLLVYGANDEGIKSVARRLEPFFERPTTLATGGHARLLDAARVEGGPEPRVGLEAWAVADEVALPGGRRRWTSVPGAFAEGRLDAGTALLLHHLPPVPSAARVLDYGAGTGFLAAGVVEAQPDARVAALEPDALAAAAARVNVPSAEVVVGAGWEALEADRRFDVIVSNPPYHRGKEETLAEIEAFLAGATRRLVRGGVLRCVVQRRLPFERAAAAAGFSTVGAVADEGPYRVWECVV